MKKTLATNQVNSDISLEKKKVAKQAAAKVQTGQLVGIGTGSTTLLVLEELAHRVKEENLTFTCVTSSYQTLYKANEYGFSVVPLEIVSSLDISIDGTDEIDPNQNLIKGGGGAHTMEKYMHSISDDFIVVADSSKKVIQLGENFPVPIEVLSYAVLGVQTKIKKLGAQRSSVRQAMHKDGPVITDNGHLIIDANFTIDNPLQLEQELNAIPGIIENGIFAQYKPKKENCFCVGYNTIA